MTEKMNVDDVERGRERRFLIRLAAAAVPFMVVCAAAGIALGDAESGDDGTLGAGTWALMIGLTLAVGLVAVAIGAGFAFWRRRRGSALFARSPLWELPTQKQRRRLLRALRRGEPIDPERHDLALRTARDVVRRRRVVWLHLGVAVLQAGNAVVQDGGARWLSLASSLIFLGLAGYMLWTVHRMRLAVARLDPRREPAQRDEP